VSAALARLRRHPAIWRRQAAPVSILPTGFPALDEMLPGAGWPMGALTEILVPREGAGELRLVMPALADLSARGRWLAWVGPPYVPYAPALEARGIALWACGAVLAWPLLVHQRRLRRLQLAAESGGAWALLFRRETPPGDGSPASLRLRVTPITSGLSVEVLKCRGRPGARVEITLDE
jgi:hypothetical protein